MELIIMKINTDILGNKNIRTYIANKEDVIIDFIGMISGHYSWMNHKNVHYDIADIEAIIDRCICQGNSMDIGYQADNIKKTNYRIKFIDDYYRKVCIDV